jgi:hypothetical protein
VAGITAKFAREQAQRVARTYDLGIGHASVIGKKTTSVKRRLAQQAKWVRCNPSQAIADAFRRTQPQYMSTIEGKDIQELLYPNR